MDLKSMQVERIEENWGNEKYWEQTGHEKVGVYNRP